MSGVEKSPYQTPADHLTRIQELTAIDRLLAANSGLQVDEIKARQEIPDAEQSAGRKINGVLNRVLLRALKEALTTTGQEVPDEAEGASVNNRFVRDITTSSGNVCSK